MLRVADALTVASPALLATRLIVPDQAPAPVHGIGQSDAANASIMSGALLVGAAVLVISGMYYMKTAPKEKGFWKGWGYFNGVSSYLGAGAYTLIGLGFGGVALAKAIRG